MPALGINQLFLTVTFSTTCVTSSHVVFWTKAIIDVCGRVFDTRVSEIEPITSTHTLAVLVVDDYWIEQSDNENESEDAIELKRKWIEDGKQEGTVTARGSLMCA